jgi:hypothetical protein
MRDRSLVRDLVETERNFCYVFVVARSEEALYRQLAARLAGDPRACVILDRRRSLTAADRLASPPAIERRATRPVLTSPLGVTVIRLTEARPTKGPTVHEPAGRRVRKTMEGIEGFGDRQRVDRWLEEGQYLVGRLIPAYLDDRERVRGRLETIEADNERLRLELADSRREIAELRADLDAHRTERTRVAESFQSIVEHLTALQAPVTDVSSRLHAIHPVAADARV